VLVGLRVCGQSFWVLDFEFRVSGFGCRLFGLGFVWGMGLLGFWGQSGV
jgi:hypothetical protein